MKVEAGRYYLRGSAITVSGETQTIYSTVYYLDDNFNDWDAMQSFKELLAKKERYQDVDNIKLTLCRLEDGQLHYSYF